MILEYNINFVIASETGLDSFAIPVDNVAKWVKISVVTLPKMLIAQKLAANRDFEICDDKVWVNSRTLSQLLQMLPWDHPIGQAARKYFATMDRAYRSYAGETLRARNKIERKLEVEEDNLDEPDYCDKKPASGCYSCKIYGLDDTPYITIGITSDLNTTIQRKRLTSRQTLAELPNDGAKAWKDIQKRNGWTNADHPRPKDTVTK
jgi:hypothetical protein